MPNPIQSPILQHTVDGLLTEKTIVITGASSGIGAEAARVFAREGASVVLGARSEDRLAELCSELRAAGSDASYVRCDVSSASDTKRLIDAAVTRHGRIDGGFNNAGIG